MAQYGTMQDAGNVELEEQVMHYPFRYRSILERHDM